MRELLKISVGTTHKSRSVYQREGNQSSPTEYKVGTIENCQPVNFQWGVKGGGGNENITEPNGWGSGKLYRDTTKILQTFPPSPPRQTVIQWPIP